VPAKGGVVKMADPFSSTVGQWKLPASAPPPSPEPTGYPGYPVNFSVPPGAKVLVPVTHGYGSTTLPTFLLTTADYNIVLTCSGPGPFAIVGSDGSTSTNDICDGSRGEFGGSGPDGTRVSLRINADPATTWEVLVYGVDVELPQP
jgi:hypothetical protein